MQSFLKTASFVDKVTLMSGKALTVTFIINRYIKDARVGGIDNLIGVRYRDPAPKVPVNVLSRNLHNSKPFCVPFCVGLNKGQNILRKHWPNFGATLKFTLRRRRVNLKIEN